MPTAKEDENNSNDGNVETKKARAAGPLEIVRKNETGTLAYSYVIICNKSFCELS